MIRDRDDLFFASAKTVWLVIIGMLFLAAMLGTGCKHFCPPEEPTYELKMAKVIKVFELEGAQSALTREGEPPFATERIALGIKGRPAAVGQVWIIRRAYSEATWYLFHPEKPEK